jgi:hypothetical protein
MVSHPTSCPTETPALRPISGKNRRITSVASYRRPPPSIPKPTANKTIGPNYFCSPSMHTTPPYPRQQKCRRSSRMDSTSSVGGELHQPRERVASSTLEWKLAASRMPEIAIEHYRESRTPWTTPQQEREARTILGVLERLPT